MKEIRIELEKGTCPVFAARAVEQEKVDHILEAVRIIPTAVNKMPVVRGYCSED